MTRIVGGISLHPTGPKTARMVFYDEAVQLWVGGRCDHMNSRKSHEGICFELWLALKGFEYKRNEFSLGHHCVGVSAEAATQLKMIFSGDRNPMDRILNDLEI